MRLADQLIKSPYYSKNYDEKANAMLKSEWTKKKEIYFLLTNEPSKELPTLTLGVPEEMIEQTKPVEEIKPTRVVLASIDGYGKISRSLFEE